MVSKALGLIETVGLVAALEAADAAVKAADVELMGYELTNGGGMVLVRLSGDVGAVKMAVEAGCLAAAKVSKVAATHIIPRPHEQLSGIITKKSIAAGKSIPAEKVQEAAEPDLQVVGERNLQVVMERNLQAVGEPDLQPAVEEVTEEVIGIQAAEAEPGNEDEDKSLRESEAQPQFITQELKVSGDVVSGVQKIKNPAEVCNFCHDPACHRKKGDPKVNCIHYGKKNEEAE